MFPLIHSILRKAFRVLLEVTLYKLINLIILLCP
uniref:Uncharacterized protein n=1 Tax=Rhizophora mucronata TaxID=61149 RepID=A0A2P2IQS3_RHIMU